MTSSDKKPETVTTPALSKEELRAKLFSQEALTRKSKIFPLNGFDVEVKEPLVSHINQYNVTSANPKKISHINILIDFVYVVGTNENLFSEGDRELLDSLPFNGDIGAIYAHIMESILGISIGEAEKN